MSASAGGAASIHREEGWQETLDRLRLFWRSWRPESPWAALLLVHGLGEHSGRYEEMASWLAGHGLAVYGFDHRGHGRSPGRRVHVSDVDEYVADVRALRALVAAREPGRPAVIVGHSQGGLVTLICVLREPGGLAGAVLSSPFIAASPHATPSALKLALAAVLVRIAPRLLVSSGLDTSVLSHDPDVERRYLEDPLVSHKVSAAWLYAMRRAQQEVWAKAGSLGLPTLVMASGEDRLVDQSAVERFARTAPAGLVEFVRWEGLFHEMFNETTRAAVFECLLRWLEATIRRR